MKGLFRARRRRHSITVEARPEDQPKVRTFIEEALGPTPFPERSRREVRLGVDEACANIIEHAYGGRSGQIQVEIAVSATQVAIILRDSGKAFDRQQVGTPDLSRYIKTGKKGGFGLYLIHKTMDEVRYARVGDENVLTLVKRFPVRQRRPRDLFLQVVLAPFLSRSLRLRFFVQASIILCVSVALVSWAVMGRTRRNAQREVLNQALALAVGLRGQASDLLIRPMAFGPKQTQLISAVKAAAARAHVSSMVVVDGEQMVWAASQEDLILTRYHPPVGAIRVIGDVDPVLGFLPDPLGRNDEPCVLAVPVMAPTPRQPSARLGTIYIAILPSRVAAQAAASRRAILVVSGVVLVLGFAGIALLIRLVVRPIQRLTDGVRAMGDGKEQRLEEAGFEEIDAIARAFNEVTGKFRDAQRSLVEQERLQQEVEVAKSIQQSLLPKALPEMSGFEIGTLYQAAKEVGGDYYDFVQVGNEAWGLAVADVSGKGVPASMVMMMIRTALRLEARGERAAAEVLDRVNRFVTADMKKGMFVTMFYVVLDSRERILSYASAGHNPMVLYRAATAETFFLKPAGFPVGIDLPDASLFAQTIQVERVALEQGDLLVVYTDGVTEAMNAQMEQFGTPRLLAAVRHHAHLSPQEFCLQLERELADFTGDTPQSDDITLVAIKERMSAPDLKIAAREKLLERVEVDRVPIEAACAELGVSPSTYYRYRRLRDQGGRDGLRDRRRRPLPTRLSNEQESVLLELVREDPERGAKRLAAVLSDRLGQEIKPGRVGGSLRRLKLSTRDERRVLAGQPPETPWRPRTQAESRKKREPRADRPAAPSPPDSGEAAGGEELEPTGT
jgi:serine phosphatase RsbU (regulator of sigma subunit)/anti-sigma regulatory factor (Ser/Thr protein kinase)/transposase